MSASRRLSLYSIALACFLVLLAGSAFTVPALTALLISSAPPVPGRTLWLVAVAVALAGWGLSWGLANRAARPLTLLGAAERGSVTRKAYLYLGQGAALAAVVIQAGLALNVLFRALLLDQPQDWLAAPASLATGSLIALALWGYLRWETARDGDFGREPGRAAVWRRAYVYLAALTGSILAIGGAGESLRTLLAGLNAGMGSAAWQPRAAALLAGLIVGALLALLAWGRANAFVRHAPASEVNALSRVLLRYGGLAFGTVVTLVSTGYLLDQVLRLVLRLPVGPYWPAALAYLPVAFITWTACAGGIRRDVASGGESAPTGAIRRLARYTMAALALAAFWFGLVEFVRLILLALLGVRPADPGAAAAWWGRFARAAALVLIGAPAWWGHWWPQQIRARTAGAAGRVERTSALRRCYLYGVMLAGACITLAALGFGAFLALNLQTVGSSGARAAGAAAGAAAGVSLIWAAAHSMTLRGDDRWLMADSGAHIANSRGRMTTEQAQPAAIVPEVIPERPAPRRFERESLPSVAEVLQSQTTAPRHRPSPSLAVVDGADGAAGAALLAALRRALPDVVLWPVGLNAAAQVAMLNALGDGTPPAAPADALSRAVAILGPSDILFPGGLDDEVTPELTAALAASPARLLLLPPRDPRLRWIAAPDWPLDRWIENAMIEAANAVQTLPARPAS